MNCTCDGVVVERSWSEWKPWRSKSLRTESDIFVRNVRTLKNKYDLTLCQSRLHTASEIFVRHKKIQIGLNLLQFLHP